MLNRKNRRKQASKIKPLKKKQVIIDLRNYNLLKLRESGIQNPDCYARSLGGCDEKLSREHFISESILKRLGGVGTKGIPWLAHLDIVLPPKALAVKSLCQYHNTFLGPLDSLAEKFFLELNNFGHSDNPRKVIISGDNFERFMLKILFGLLSTNKIEFKNTKYTTDNLGKIWLEVLFGKQSMPSQLGLFIFYKVNDQIKFEKMIKVAPVYLDGKVMGIQLDFAGFRFGLSFEPREKAFDFSHPNVASLLMSPKSINKTPYPQEIVFDWSPSR